MKTEWLPHLHLQAWREKSGLTQKQIGNKLCLTKFTLSRWEAGKRHMTLDDLGRIAELLQVEAAALFLAPADYDLAVCSHRFAAFAKEAGPSRTKALLDGMGAPNRGRPLSLAENGKSGA